MTMPGNVTSHQEEKPSLGTLADELPERRRRRLNAEAEERERGLEEDGGRDQERHGDDDRPHGAREHVPEHDAHVSRTRGLRRLDELLLAQREEGAADDARESDPDQQRDDDADAPRLALAEVGGEHEQDCEERNDEDQVDEPHEQVVDDPAVVAGDRADDRSQHGRDGRDEERDPERRLKPVNDPAQVVAAELVGSEEMPPVERRPHDDVLEVELVVAVRRDLVREYGDERHEDQDDQARDRQLVAEEADPRVRPLAPRLELEAGLVGELDIARDRSSRRDGGSERVGNGVRIAHSRRTRGSSQP